MLPRSIPAATAARRVGRASVRAAASKIRMCEVLRRMRSSNHTPIACPSCARRTPKVGSSVIRAGQKLTESSAADPRSYTPKHLVERVLDSRGRANAHYRTPRRRLRAWKFRATCRLKPASSPRHVQRTSRLHHAMGRMNKSAQRASCGPAMSVNIDRGELAGFSRHVARTSTREAGGAGCGSGHSRGPANPHPFDECSGCRSEDRQPRTQLAFCPHESQNSRPLGFAVPQLGQAIGVMIRAAHSPQNFHIPDFEAAARTLALQRRAAVAAELDRGASRGCTLRNASATMGSASSAAESRGTLDIA